MKVKLNIYKGKEIVKTYESDDFNLMTGTCEDIINMIDVDKLTSGKLDEQALGIEVIKVVKNPEKKEDHD